MPFVQADPYCYPQSGDLNPETTALVIIDMQADFCSPAGYLAQKGYDVALTRAVIAPIQAVLAMARQKGLHIFFTREGHRSDLTDLPETKRWRNEKAGAAIGSLGAMGRLLVRDEAGWDIIPELRPLPGEPVIDKPGNGAFYATDFDHLLRQRQVRQLILCGVTTAVCVHSTLREASDRGYDTLLLEDCCAESDEALHRAAVAMVKMEGGIFGMVASSPALIAALAQL